MSEFNESILIDGVRRLEVRVPRGDVDVRRIGGDSILVESDSPISVEREANAVHIRSGGSGQRPRSRVKPPLMFSAEGSNFGAAIGEMVSSAVESILAVDINFSGFGSAHLHVGVPATLELPDLVVSTGMGDVLVEDLSGNCTVHTSKGEIEVKGGAGSLQASTGMGDLSVDRFAGPITAHTGAGDAAIKGCDEGGAVQTGSGDIRADDIAGAWNVRSGAGDVDIRIGGEASLEVVTGAGDIAVDRGSLHRLSVHSGSGDIDCLSLLSGPRHQLSTGHGDLTVAIADPPGARLQVITRNGEVKSEYPLVGVGKQGRYAGNGGRYVGNIGNSSIDVELRTGSGDISIKKHSANADGSPSAAWFSQQPSPEPPNKPSAPQFPVAPQPPRPFSAPNPAFPPGASEFHVPAQASAEFPAPNAPFSEVAPSKQTPMTSPDAGPSPEFSGGNPRLAILENLQAGKISVNEAVALLESLNRSGTARF